MFACSDVGSVMNDDSLLLHLQSEFADLKTTTINQQLSWRTWWSLKKERFTYLYPIVQTLLSLAPTEAAGSETTYTHTHTHTHTDAYIYIRLFLCTVERSFSKQGFIHADLTNRKQHSLVAAQMMISFNHKPLHEKDNSYIYKLNDKQIEFDNAMNIEEADDDDDTDNDINYRHKEISSSSSASSSSSSSSSSSASLSSSVTGIADDAALAFALSVPETTQFRYVCTRSGRQTRQKVAQ